MQIPLVLPTHPLGICMEFQCKTPLEMTGHKPRAMVLCTINSISQCLGHWPIEFRAHRTIAQGVFLIKFQSPYRFVEEGFSVAYAETLWQRLWVVYIDDPVALKNAVDH